MVKVWMCRDMPQESLSLEHQMFRQELQSTRRCHLISRSWTAIRQQLLDHSLTIDVLSQQGSSPGNVLDLHPETGAHPVDDHHDWIASPFETHGDHWAMAKSHLSALAQLRHGLQQLHFGPAGGSRGGGDLW